MAAEPIKLDAEACLGKLTSKLMYKQKAVMIRGVKLWRYGMVAFCFRAPGGVFHVSLYRRTGVGVPQGLAGREAFNPDVDMVCVSPRQPPFGRYRVPGVFQSVEDFVVGVRGLASTLDPNLCVDKIGDRYVSDTMRGVVERRFYTAEENRETEVRHGS